MFETRWSSAGTTGLLMVTGPALWGAVCRVKRRGGAGFSADLRPHGSRGSIGPAACLRGGCTGGYGGLLDYRLGRVRARTTWGSVGVAQLADSDPGEGFEPQADEAQEGEQQQWAEQGVGAA